MIDEIDELSKARVDLAQLQADFDELQDQLDGIHEDIAEHLPHYALSEDDSDEANPSETVEYAGDELRAVTAERDRIMVELGETITQRDKLIAEVERLRRDRDSYANSNFEGQLSEARAEVERLRAGLIAANANHEMFERKWFLATDEIENLRAERDELRAEVERLRGLCEEAAGIAAVYRGDCANDWPNDDARLQVVRELLEANGCDCPCEHHWEDHDDDCERCPGVRHRRGGGPVSHKDGRVVLSAWVDPVVRDYAREAARLSGLEFSRWVERAVRQTMAHESADRAMEKGQIDE